MDKWKPSFEEIIKELEKIYTSIDNKILGSILRLKFELEEEILINLEEIIKKIKENDSEDDSNYYNPSCY